MPTVLPLVAVLSTLHLTGVVPPADGDYLLVPFEVPAGTVEFSLGHDDGSPSQILDWGVWSPDGFRGWGGGLSDPAVIGVAGSSRGYLPGPIAPGAWTLVIGKALLLGVDGHYTVDVEFRDAATLTPEPAAPWAAVTVATARRWYAGDFHVHSRDSGDATASLAEIVALARSRGLDFVVLSDHNTTAQLEHQAAVQAQLTDLLLVRGAEVTTYGGHGNAIGTGAYVDHRVGLDGASATTIVDDVAAQGGVFVVNHPELRLGDACIGCAWDHADTPWAKVSGLEIHTGNFDVTGTLFTPKAIARWDALADEGFRLAAIGGSDDHRAGGDTGPAPALLGSPTTMVLADALSEAALLDAVRAGRTEVKLRGPEAPTVELTAIDPADATRRAGLGDTLDGSAAVRFEVGAPGGDGTTAELWRDGALVARSPIVAGAASFERDVTGAVERYRVELTDLEGRLVVTSHLYVHGTPAAAADGCGCAGGRGAGPGVALVLLGLAARRRRR